MHAELPDFPPAVTVFTPANSPALSDEWDRRVFRAPPLERILRPIDARVVAAELLAERSPCSLAPAAR